MYHEIQRLVRDRLTLSAISKFLGINRRTVTRYSLMSESEYSSFLEKKDIRDKLLTPYESFVHGKLQSHPGVSAAQMHDWLKEYHPDFPRTAPKTVYNFVMWLRRKYNIPLDEPGRDFFVVEELPYGQQAQADFGQYILRSITDKCRRVYFFVMMLSRSRMKFVRFSDCPFTTRTAIDAHEEAFRFFRGKTLEVVYDQDRLFLVDEGLGDLLLTREFKDYVSEQQFHTYFCRKNDPQSKGKVENVVKYVKQNFLYARPYSDIETLQSQALGWLQRTGNGMPHSTTKKIPLEEWEIEQRALQSWISSKILPSYITRNVRKDNILAWQGNFYSVPQGTYKSKDTAVMIWLKEDELHIHNLGGVFICSHKLVESKGNTVINTDHRRDKSLKLKVLLTQTAGKFLNPGVALEYFEMLRQEKPRYQRDQVQAIAKCIEGMSKELVADVLQKCIDQRYVGAVMFRQLLALQQAEQYYPVGPACKIILLDSNNNKKADIKPDKSDLNTYQNAFETS